MGVFTYFPFGAEIDNHLRGTEHVGSARFAKEMLSTLQIIAMKKNKPLQKQIEKLCPNIPGIQTLFAADVVRVAAPKGTQSDKIVACTHFHFLIFCSKRVKKNMKISTKILWDDVAEISSQSNESISIKLENEQIYTFSLCNAVELMVSVAKHIKSIIPKRELPKFNFNKQYMVGFKYPRDAMEKRIRYTAFKSNIELDSAFLKKIRAMTSINSIYSALNFKDFEDCSQYYALLLDSLEFFPQINKLIVPKMNNEINFWKLLNDFIPKNQTIQSLETYEPLKTCFDEFSDSFCENHMITDIAFHDNVFNENFVTKLLNMVKTGKLHSLSVVNRLSKEGYQALRPLLFSNNDFQSMQTLCLSNCKYVVADDIFESIHGIRVLILDNCNLDLTSVLKSISINHPKELVDLQVNDNAFKTSIDFDIVFPEKLKSLNMDNVLMQDDELIKIFESLNSSRIDCSSFTLSVRNCKQSDHQWDNFYSFIGNFDCVPLKKLILDRNPVREDICIFIKNSKWLKILSMRGCLSFETPFLHEFGIALSENKSLVKLFISGESNKYLSQSLKILIDYISQNTTIQTLDISNNYSGDSLVPKLLELFSKNNSLLELFFDQNNIRPVTIKDFLTKLQLEGIGLQIHIPRNDLIKGNADQNEILEIHAINEILLKKLMIKMKNSQTKDSRNNDSLEKTNTDENSDKELITEESVFPYTIKLASQLPPEIRAEIQKVNNDYINNSFMTELCFHPVTNDDDEYEQLKKRYSIQTLKEELCKE